MKIHYNGENTYVELPNFSLAKTLDCGQCFRFSGNMEEDNLIWSGVYKSKILKASQDGDVITFYSMTEEEFRSTWAEFFDFESDYEYMKDFLSFDDSIREACKTCGGIRILKQDPWEALCSFIISQNNNIPRIKGIIGRLCESFGEEIESGVYAFPTAEVISALSVEDLAPLRAGFRAKYIIDASRKVASGEVDFDAIFKNDLEFGEKELRKITGVGPKVAQCVLLFGFYKLDAFPIDVWIKKVLAEYYPDGFPEKARAYAGVAQQFLFHHIRGRE